MLSIDFSCLSLYINLKHITFKILKQHAVRITNLPPLISLQSLKKKANLIEVKLIGSEHSTETGCSYKPIGFVSLIHGLVKLTLLLGSIKCLRYDVNCVD